MDAQYTGMKIAEQRKRKGWTQKTIADKLHVSVAAVSKWERGLNYPDLSIMEDLAETLELSVAELLGIENESAEQVIRNIAFTSANEKRIAERRLRKQLCIIGATVVAFVLAFHLALFLMSNQDVLRRVFEVCGHGVLDLIAIIAGLISWTFAIIGIFSRSNSLKWKNYSILSFLWCVISMHMPALITFLIVRFEYLSTIEDIAGGYFFGAAILLSGTMLLNLCSWLIHRE